MLFHTLDLWAPSRHNPVARPAEGNGSCASCHGAYAPRYVNDPNFLATPALEGMASYIMPQRIIASDPDRQQTNNEAVQLAGATTSSATRTTAGTPTTAARRTAPTCAATASSATSRRRSTACGPRAPYLHNGSVPNVWEVLKPADRKALWKRESKAPRLDQTGRVIMGYDTSDGRLRHGEAGLEVRHRHVSEPDHPEPVPVPVPAVRSRRRPAPRGTRPAEACTAT